MSWFTLLLIIAFAGATAIFGYLIYLVWKEISFLLKDAQKLKTPIARLAEDASRLQLLIQSFSENVNQRMMEVSEVIELAKDTSIQMGSLVAAIAAYRSPNVQIAIRYGRDFVEERRAHPLVRKLKRATKNLRNRFRKLKNRLQGD